MSLEAEGTVNALRHARDGVSREGYVAVATVLRTRLSAAVGLG